MTTILLAIDESDASHHAAAQARQLFGDDVQYLAIYVDDSPSSTSSFVWGSVYGYTFTPPQVLESLAEAATGTLDDAEADAGRYAADAGVEATALGAVGNAADAIARAAQAHDADAIVVGHHQRGWFASLFDRSVADDLVAHAHRPVLVVPDDGGRA